MRGRPDADYSLTVGDDGAGKVIASTATPTPRWVEAADAAVREQIAREQIRDKPKPVMSRERDFGRKRTP
jgi:hypothetical protein